MSDPVAIVEAMGSHEDEQQSCAEAMGYDEAAAYHEKRAKLLAEVVAAIKQAAPRAKPLPVVGEPRFPVLKQGTKAEMPRGEPMTDPTPSTEALCADAAFFVRIPEHEHDATPWRTGLHSIVTALVARTRELEAENAKLRGLPIADSRMVSRGVARSLAAEAEVAALRTKLAETEAERDEARRERDEARAALDAAVDPSMERNAKGLVDTVRAMRDEAVTERDAALAKLAEIEAAAEPMPRNPHHVWAPSSHTLDAIRAALSLAPSTALAERDARVLEAAADTFRAPGAHGWREMRHYVTGYATGDKDARDHLRYLARKARALANPPPKPTE